MTFAVLFDLDDTLVDHTSAAADAVLAWAAEVAPAGGVGQHLVGLWRDIDREHFDSFLSGQYSFEEHRRRRLRAFLPTLGLPVVEASLDEQFAGYLRHYEASWQMYPDVVDTLVALRSYGVSVGVLTNGDKQQQRRKLSMAGLDNSFDVVLTSSELGVAKPDPYGFRVACSRLGCEPGNVWYVGDNLHVDYLGSRAAGLQGIWLNRRGAPSELSIHQIDRLTRLPLLLSSVPTARKSDPPSHASWARELGRFGDIIGDAAAWMVTGSAALAVHGAAIMPKDIDVITDREGMAVILQRFGGALVNEPYDAVGVQAATRLRLGHGEMAIEVLVDVQNRRPDGTWSAVSALSDSVRVRWLGKTISTMPLSTLYRIAHDRGRDEHVTAIESLLTRRGIKHSALARHR